MFERFTERARKVMSMARQETQRLNADGIAPEHILLGILQEGGGVAAKALSETHFEAVGRLGNVIRQEIDKLAIVSNSPGVTLGQIPFTVRAKKVIEQAEENAVRLAHEVVGTEHLLLGILADEDGVPCQVLKNIGMDRVALKDKIFEIIGIEAAVTYPEKVELPEGLELQEMMTKVSLLVEEIDARMAKLAKEYGIHSDPVGVGRAMVQLTRMGDRWGIEYQGIGQPERITGCRFDVKLEFLAKAKQFEGLYKAKIMALHHRAKSVIENHLKDEK